MEGRGEIERNSVGEGYDATTFDSALERGDDNAGDDRASSKLLYTQSRFFFEPKRDLCFPRLSRRLSANSFLIS